MRIITKFMLALSVVGSLSLASCKDYDEDNYENAIITHQRTVDEVLRLQIEELKITIKELDEQKLDITEATKTIEDYLSGAVNNKNSAFYQALSDYITQSGLDGRIKSLEDMLKFSEEAYKEDAFTRKVEWVIRNTIETRVVNLESRLDRIYNDSIKPAYEWMWRHSDSLVILDGKISSLDGQLGSKIGRSELLDSLASCKRQWEKYTDDKIADVNRQLANKVDKTSFDSLATVVKNVEEKMSARIDSLALVTKNLMDDVDSLKKSIDSLNDARIKQVTGIIVQQVHNPAFGSYNSILTNLQSNILVTYYGTAAQGITMLGDQEVNIKSGATLVDANEGNAGRLYLTINPREVDFTGVAEGVLKLVNSQDAESDFALGEVKSSDAVLSLGGTRAAGNGLYEVEVTIPVEKVTDSNNNISVDGGAIKKALSNLVSVRSGSGAKLALKEIASTAVSTAASLKTPALGVKASWTDMYGEHSVVSNYNIAAVAVKPLGFNSVDGIFAEGGAYWRNYDKTKDFITSTAKRVGKRLATSLKNQFNLGKIGSDIDDLLSRVHHIDEIKIGEGKTFTATVTIPGQPISVGPWEKEVVIPLKPNAVAGDVIPVETTVQIKVPTKYNDETGQWDYKTENVTHKEDITVEAAEVGRETITRTITIPAQVVKTEPQTVDVDVTESVNDWFKDVIGGVNDGFDDVNDFLDALETALKDVNDMLDAINNLEDKFDGAFLEPIYEYLDKMANNVAVAIPALFKPTLLVKSDNGFGLCGIEGAPSKVSGNVTLYPTTYSAELLAPIYKRYIKVNDNPGEILDSKSKDITSLLKAGKNIIEYRALDYYGNEWVGTYMIER